MVFQYCMSRHCPLSRFQVLISFNIFWSMKKVWKIKTWNDNTPPLSGRRQITLSKTEEICQWAIQNQSPQYQCTYQIWWKSIEIYSSYCPETKIWMCCRQITVKNWQNLPISSSKADLQNIKAHTEFGENPLIFTKLSSWNENTDVSRANNCQKSTKVFH